MKIGDQGDFCNELKRILSAVGRESESMLSGIRWSLIRNKGTNEMRSNSIKEFQRKFCQESEGVLFRMRGREELMEIEILSGIAFIRNSTRVCNKKKF